MTVDWEQLDQDREAHQSICELIDSGEVELIGRNDRGEPFYAWTDRAWRKHHPWKVRIQLALVLGVLALVAFGYYELVRWVAG